MSLSAAEKAGSGRGGPSSAAGAGAALRVVLFDPRRGFAAASALAERTNRSAAAGLFAAVGGAAAMLLWLKVGALTGSRGSGVAVFNWSYVAVSLAAGAVAGLAAQRLWASPLRRIAAGAGGPKPAQLRAVWGLSCLPQLAALLILLPLDVLIGGPAAFTTQPLAGPMATGWTAVSIALGISLACWSAYLFIVGTGSGLGWQGLRRAAGITTAVGSWAIVVAVFVGAAVLALRMS